MKKLIFIILRYSGLPYFFREVLHKRKVTILMFHDIEIENAEKVFPYLVKKYNIVDLNDYIKTSSKENGFYLPKKSLIITFDDGHVGNYKLLPIIKKYDIPVTIFLCSSIVNTNRNFWFLFEKDSSEVERMKDLPNEERLEILAKKGFKQDKDYEKPQALQKAHIDEMKPYVNFQSHTMFHPILTMCNDEDSRQEIFGSKKYLESQFGLNINTIAFPNGNYTEREIQYVKEAGYKCAITVDFGVNSINSDLYRLKRLSSNDTNDLNELIVKSSGVWSKIRKIVP